ncbi:MAG: hypothetical protein ACKOEO_23640, partial [Planctomycetaceae bacterium]
GIEAAFRPDWENFNAIGGGAGVQGVREVLWLVLRGCRPGLMELALQAGGRKRGIELGESKPGESRLSEWRAVRTIRSWLFNSASAPVPLPSATNVFLRHNGTCLRWNHTACDLKAVRWLLC